MNMPFALPHKHLLSRLVSHLLPWSVVRNLLMLVVAYMMCRVAFLAENWNMFESGLSCPLVAKMIHGGLVFDLAAIFYTNTLWLVLTLLPLHWKEVGWWRLLLKCLFIVVNAVCIASNLMDSVYFPFGKHRASALIFSEFGNEGNLFTILCIELVRHWYLTLLFVIILYALWKRYRSHVVSCSLRAYYVRHTLWLALCAGVAVVCIRGGATTAIRPLTVSNAHQYVNHPMQTAIVLNTPFSILRTIGKATIDVPRWFSDDELGQLYSPMHLPADSIAPDKRNIVLLIVESFAQEFVGALNRDLDDGAYCGYTEFTDSLLPHCLTFEHTFCSGTVSIDAIPSICASIPRMKHAFMLTPYSLNHITGLAGELHSWGYETAFFHGAENSSMGFQAFARSAGFQRYYGRTEYCQDSRFNGDDDFDGTWAIWDEPFLQFFAEKMDEMREPFCASVFTASSHHPFAIPEKYKDVYKDEGRHKLHKCIRYTDNALRRFFSTARTKNWYTNTIFVIVADHASSKTTHDRYKTLWGDYRIPILFYDPSGRIPTGIMPGVACQIDIMPTLLGMVGYDKPYIAFGRDLLHDADTVGRALNWVHVPVWYEGNHVFVFNESATAVDAVYDYVADPLLQHNIVGQCAEQPAAERRARAFMQSLYTRMRDDRMVVQP